MKIIYRQGDLLQTPETVICHGCNARGSMGAGFALAVRKTYPVAFDRYRAVFLDQGKRLELGQCIWVDCPDGRTVINAVTQADYGRDPNVVYVSYDAVSAVMQQIDVWTKTRGGAQTVAFPKIGAGLANGDWSVIEKIIETEARYFQPVVYTL